MKEKNVDLSFRKKIIAILIVGFGLCLVAGVVSYAYFTITVNGNLNVNDTVVTTGNMEVTYEGGNDITSLENMIPGQSVTKTFTVRNTGSMAGEYSIYLNDIVNTFTDKNDLVYTLTSTGGGTNINQTIYPSYNTEIAGNIPIAYQGVHVYTLTITFLETHDNQDDNKGAMFRGSISLEQKNNNNYVAYKTIYDKPDPVYAGNTISDTTTVFMSPETLVAQTGKKYMIKETTAQTYTGVAAKYAIKAYSDVLYAKMIEEDPEGPTPPYYEELTECEEELQYGDEKQKAACYESNDKYFISRFEVWYDSNNDEYEGLYDDVTECQEDASEWNEDDGVENAYRCELYNEDEIGNPVLDTETKTGELCIYVNNALDCIDMDDGWDAPETNTTTQEMTAFMNSHPSFDCYDNGWGNLECNYNNEVSIKYDTNSQRFEVSGYYVEYSRKYNNEQFNDYDDCETYISNNNLSNVICNPDYINKKVALYHYNLNEYENSSNSYYYNSFSESEMNICTQNNTYSCGMSRLTNDGLKCRISSSSYGCVWDGNQM